MNTCEFCGLRNDLADECCAAGTAALMAAEEAMASALLADQPIGDGTETHTDTSPNLGEFGPALHETPEGTTVEIGVAPGPNAKHANREEWLRAAVDKFRPWFSLINKPLPRDIRISCGWGATGARQENATILGVTLRRDLSADNVSEIFISPEDADATSMLETVLHELIHVQDNIKSGHRGEFVTIAKALGFTKPWTETPAGSDLARALRDLAWDLGAYPGAKISIPTARPRGDVLQLPPGLPTGGISSAGNPQRNRHILCKCTFEGCVTGGYQVRTTRTWIEGWGMPLCPFGHVMTMQ